MSLEADSSVFCLYTGEALKEEEEITLPKNVVFGSARASLSVLGNLIHLFHLNVILTKQILVL